MDLHEMCILAATEFSKMNLTRHISYIPEIELLKKKNLIPKVTIEWVDESETDYDEER